jgi:hypothetical protein
MATTTPNYGWDVPTSSDYVKDGALAIETLGDDIDASLYTALGGNYPGLRLIKRQTVGSAVTTVTVTGAFNSTYDNYRIILKGINPSLSNSFKFMLGTGATTGHYGASFYYQFNGAQSGYLLSNNSGSVYLTLNGGAGTGFIPFDVMSPNEAANTGISGIGWGRTHSAWFSGTVENSTQYTSFTLLTDGAGTMTGGTIDVYGYGKS